MPRGDTSSLMLDMLHTVVGLVSTGDDNELLVLYWFTGFTSLHGSLTAGKVATDVLRA